MLICSLTICVYLQVCVRDNMIFAHESKKKRGDKVNCSSPSNNWIWSRSAARKNIHTYAYIYIHCSRRVKEKRTHESAHWKCKVNCYCCVLLLLCSLSDSQENCRFSHVLSLPLSLSFSFSWLLSSSNRIFDHQLSSNEMTQIELDYLYDDWLLVVNSIAIYVFF